MKPRLTLLLLLVSFAVFACGPHFPVSYLAADTPRKPDNELAYAVELLGRHFYPEEWGRTFSTQEGLSTPEATKADFLAAGTGLPAPELDAAGERYFAFDAACRSGKEAPPYEISAIPPCFREFYLYSAGFAELGRCGDGRIPEAWTQLSALPGAERKYRTTWVLYMSGNLCRNADERFAYYRKLRHAVQSGFADSSNLAERSLDRVWKTARTPEEELRYLPADPAVCWDSFMIRHLRRLTAAAWNSDKSRMCQDPLLCEIALLAFGPREVLPELPPDFRPLVAERLAVHCYFNNDLDGCRMLLPRIPEESLIRLYLEARFARRNGDTALAAEKLSRWLAVYREQGKERKNPLSFIPDYSAGLTEYAGLSDEAIAFPEEVSGVLGAIRIQQEDFLEALYAFIAARSWYDAAFVAEFLLPTDTLVEYCRNHTSADTKDGMQIRLRDLLARKLMREYRVDEAREFFSAQCRPLYELYRSTVIAANDPARSRTERALALFQLGRILRQKGEILRGTELQPDQVMRHYPELTQSDQFYRQPGLYDFEKFDDLSYPWRLTLEMATRRSALRRQAADCFARSAMLAEDPELKAAGLWTAGTCLKNRTPSEANQYYQMLCDLEDAPMSEETRRQRWFSWNAELYHLIETAPLEPAPTREQIVRAAKQEK